MALSAQTVDIANPAGPNLISVVGNIRDELEAALQDKSTDFNASFSFSRSYPDAPNPALKLSDVGLVGLPLSTRDAELVKSRSIQAPFGMGERTVVDTTVRDTWEMDARLVTFINPKWNTFVTQVVAEVCQTLGVNFQESRPRAELYKLLLYETGSHFLPHVDTEKADGMFATIVIVLPSQFTGGAAHLSHGDLDAVYDCSAKSQLETTVLSWYTDVRHEIKPITSGYRLALSYNLIHTTQSLHPALSANTALVDKLSRVLLAWKDDEEDEGPEKIVYLLDHKYSEANLKASALKGADAQKVAILQILAQRHGFGLGLANAHCRLSGPADDHGGSYYRRDRWRGYYDEDEDEDDDNVDFAEVESREMTIEHFVDLNGRLISQMLDYDEESETIPAELTEDVESGECDGQEYEGYMGNGAGSLERWYRRTVLVIWPNRNNSSILYQGDVGFERACEHLAKTVSTEPSPEQTELINFITSKHATNPKQAADALCIAACDLEDSSLWEKAITLCSPSLGMATISNELKREAIENFGFEIVKPSFEVMLKHDKHNLPRLEFLSSLAGEPWEPRITSKAKVQELHEQAKPWAVSQIQEVLKTVKKPTVAECSVLLRAARVYGGINFLQESMLPQLLPVADEDFLREFAGMVYSDKEFPECEDKTPVIPTLLSTAISKATFYKPKPPQPTYYYANRPPTMTVTSDLDMTKKYVQLCSDLQCPQLIGTIVDRIINTSGFSPSDAQECAKSVMLPLATFLIEQIRLNPAAVQIPQVEELRTTAMKLYLDWVENNPRSLDKQEVTKLLDMCMVNGDPAVFMTTVVPRLEAMKLSDQAVREFVDEVRRQRARFVFPEEYAGRTLDSVIVAFAEKYIKSVTAHSPAVVLHVLNWCSSLQIPTLLQLAIDQFTHPAKLNAQYVRTVLVPLLPELRSWGLKNGILDSLAPAFQKIVAAWNDKILGPSPQPNPSLARQLKDLAKWTCSCEQCSTAKKFLTTMAGSSTSLDRIGAPSRKHLEQQLSVHARGLATFTMIRSTPQGLTVAKSKPLDTLMTWRVEQSKGVAMLKTISTDDAELRRLLSTEYNRAMSALRGSATAPSHGAHASTSSAARSAQAASNPTSTSLPQVPAAAPATRAPSASASSTSQQAATPAPPVAPAAAHPRSDNPPGQPPAKKRKMLPVESGDVIDLT